MTRLYDYLCLNGTEVALADRTLSYVRNGIVSSEWEASADCYDCELLRDGDTYVDPATDDAPWYDPNVPASTEFFGIIPTRVELLTALNRTVTSRVTGGGVVGPLRPKPRVLQFTGIMAANSPAGMTYGERWLNEVLAGSQCGDVLMDEATVLTACPSDDYVVAEEFYLRRLLDVGIADGPVVKPLNNISAECKISEVSFQLTAGQPYLYSPEILVTEDELISESYTYSGDVCHTISTTDWTGDAVANITIKALEDTSYLKLSAKVSFDGDCPVAEGEACWTVTIPSLPKDSTLVIDSARRQVRYTSPSLKIARSGVHLLEFQGPLTFPEISPCSTVCICAGAETDNTASITIAKVIREW